ncbi:thiol reductant ABC exporter subunit CydC [Cobetia sp. 10Alg 146]|uniref:thiol reductant ABC exporter subunit CydC n=1 Tax=Cobetia sp. 10Alg 146 TaxID=3040019 RepID=UPI002449E05A|nr:thiol reductant ABC exporter subunit CydC [Cobetia sp. 10Alg 146]MDH2289939.1 thiol reductant ABC exporter subunit CydC [Cobetia sp. 10Alg 146]
MTHPETDGVTLREALTRLAPWWRLHDQYRRRLILGVVLMMLTACSALGLLAVSGWFITASALTGAALAAGAGMTLDVYTPGSGIRLFAVSRTVSRYLERLYNHDTILRLLASLRGTAFAALVTMDPARVAARRSSDWLNRLTADIDTLDALYLRLAAPPLMALGLIAVLVALVAVWLPVTAAWLAGFLLLSWAWLTLGQARWGLVASRRRVTTLESLRSALMETLRGQAELEAYAALGSARQRLDEIETRLLRDQWRLAVITAIGNGLASLVIGLSWLLLLAAAMQGMTDERLTPAVMVMLPLAAMALSEGLAGLPAAFTQAGATLGAAERLNELSSATRPLEGRQTLVSGAVQVQIQQVSWRYPGAWFEALDEITLEITPGTQMAICGASGSGKSTLATLLTGQTRLQSGSITLNGQPIDACSPESLAHAVGCLTQQVELLDASLADNLRLGARQASDEDVWQALEAVDLAEWVAQLPQGLATRVGEGGRQVSGGQARRLGLARLVLTDPGLLILDEPFSGLDARTAQRMAQRLEGWFKARTVIYMLHEHDLASPRPGTQSITRVHSLPVTSSALAQKEL